MITIALCDDETKYLDFYESKLTEISSKHHLLIDVIRFKNGESLLFYLEDHPNKFDIIYLDVITGGMTGIDTALAIRKFNQQSKIIFLTSSESYVYQSFDAKATNYLIKSLHDDKFESTFLSTVKNLHDGSHQKVITFKRQQTEITFNLFEITHFESYQRMILVHTVDHKTHEFYYKLSDLKDQLSESDFVMTHRSFLVNLQFIKKISKQSILLKNQVEIPISRNLSQMVTQTYMNYLNQ